MADQHVITQAYELKSIGASTVVADLSKINQLLKEIRDQKRQLGELKIKIEDTAALGEIQRQLAAVKLQEAQLNQELKKKQVILKEQELANKLQAAGLVQIRQQQAEVLLQIRELTLARQQETAQARAARAGNEALAGSYNDVAKRYRELLAIAKNTTPVGDPHEVAAAAAELQKLKTQLDAFNRSLSADGTLVGEYTTGILNAFKRLGLGDLIQNQADQARAALTQLDGDFERLRQELRNVQQTGQGSLDSLERQLIENRQAAAGVQRQLGEMEAVLRSNGETGERMVAGLNRGFAGLRSQISTLVAGYIGFQALIIGLPNLIGNVFRETASIDSMDAALANVSKTEEELAINTKFLQDVTQRYGLQIIDTTKAFNNFYASATNAGLSAIETREIFKSVGQAAAFMKLSQADANGILLAFGQIAGKGKVQAEELRGQIGERLPGAFSIAARAIGVTEQQLNKMLEQGQVVAADFLPKFAAELSKTFGGDSQKQVTGLTASFNRFKNEIVSFIEDKKSSFVGFFQSIIDSGTNFLKFLKQLGENKAVQALLYSIGSVVGFVTGNLGLLVTIGGLYLTGLALQNALLIEQNVQLLVLNARIAISRVLLAALTIIQTSYNAVLALFTLGTRAATVGTTLLGNAMRLLPIGILLTLVAALAATMKAFAGSLDGTNEKMREKLRLQQLDADLTKEVNDATADAVSKTQSLVAAINSENTSKAAKVRLLEELKVSGQGYLDQLTLENIKTKEGTALLTGYIQALKEKAQFEAASAGRSKALQEQLQFQEEGNRAAKDEDFAKQKYRDLVDENSTFLSAPFMSSLVDAVKFGTIHSEQAFLKQYYKQRADEAQKTIDFYDQRINGAIIKQAENTKDALAGTVAARRTFLEGEIKRLKEDYEKLAETDIKGREANLEQRKKLKKELDELDGKDPKETPAAKLSGQEKDAGAIAEAKRDRLVAVENARYEQIKLTHQLTTEEEVEHLQKLYDIEQEYNKGRMAAIKGNNAQEQKVRADFQLKEVTDLRDFTAAKFKIYQDSLEAQRQSLENEAADRLAGVEGDPGASEVEKKAARANYYADLLAIQKAFNGAMLELEKSYGKQSEATEQERGRKLLQARRAANAALADAGKAAGENEVAEIQQQLQAQLEQVYQRLYAGARRIFENQTTTAQQRQAAIQRLEAQARREAAQATINSTDQELATYRFLLDSKLISQQEYNKQAARLANDRHQAELALINAEIDAQRRKNKLISDIEQTAQRIGQAYINAYIENQNKKIEATYDEAQAVQDTEKKKLLDQATSDEEKLQIEAEYDQKNKELARQRNQENKEVKKKQLYLELALASARAIANALTVPGAGIFEALVAEALVVAEFAANLSILESQQFAQGGHLGKNSRVLQAGGIFDGPSHAGGGIPFYFAGAPREVEGQEGYVIKGSSMATGDRYTVSGTPAQLASAANTIGGGVNFAPGATVRSFEYGGYLGSQLQAPVFVASASAGGQQQQIDALFRAILETNRGLASMQVVLNPNAVQQSNDQRQRLVQLGTL